MLFKGITMMVRIDMQQFVIWVKIFCAAQGEERARHYRKGTIIQFCSLF